MNSTQIGFERPRQTSEELPVRVRVESDHPGLPLPDGGSSEVAAGTQTGLHEFGEFGRVVLEIELEHLLALRHDHARRIAKDLHEILLSVAFLGRVDRLTDRHIPAGEKIVGAGAARSALAVVVPVDALGHGVLLDLRGVPGSFVNQLTRGSQAYTIQTGSTSAEPYRRAGTNCPRNDRTTSICSSSGMTSRGGTCRNNPREPLRNASDKIA